MNILSCILIADFASGIGHWFEDAYGNPNWKFGSSIVKSNIEHHSTPTSFLGRSYWSRNSQGIIFFSILATLLSVIGFFSWQLLFICGLLSQVNEIHAFAHTKSSKTPKLVECLQEIGVLQSQRHHGKHHAKPYEYRMCIITNFLNPILDSIRFWTCLEFLIKKIFRVDPLRATEVRGFK